MTRMMFLGYGNGTQFAIITEETRGRWKIRRLFGRHDKVGYSEDGTRRWGPTVAPTDTFISKKDPRIIRIYDDFRDIAEIEKRHRSGLYDLSIEQIDRMIALAQEGAQA